MKSTRIVNAEEQFFEFIFTALFTIALLPLRILFLVWKPATEVRWLLIFAWIAFLLWSFFAYGLTHFHTLPVPRS